MFLNRLVLKQINQSCSAQHSTLEDSLTQPSKISASEVRRGWSARGQIKGPLHRFSLVLFSPAILKVAKVHLYSKFIQNFSATAYLPYLLRCLPFSWGTFAQFFITTPRNLICRQRFGPIEGRLKGQRFRMVVEQDHRPEGSQWFSSPSQVPPPPSSVCSTSHRGYSFANCLGRPKRLSQISK